MAENMTENIILDTRCNDMIKLNLAICRIYMIYIITKITRH